MTPLKYTEIINRLHVLKAKGATKGCINFVYNRLVKENRRYFESDQDEYFLIVELMKLNK